MEAKSAREVLPGFRTNSNVTQIVVVEQASSRDFTSLGTSRYTRRLGAVENKNNDM